MLCFFIFVQRIAAPYRRKWDNKMEQFSLLMLLLLACVRGSAAYSEKMAPKVILIVVFAASFVVLGIWVAVNIPIVQAIAAKIKQLIQTGLEKCKRKSKASKVEQAEQTAQ